MNIFYLSKNQDECASYYHDQHVVKMILESVQMLSNAIMFHGGYSKYAATHINHPCSIWVRQSKQNFYWLLGLIDSLNHEYKYRYEKYIDHKSYDIAIWLLDQVELIPDGDFTEPPACMPDEYVTAGDIVDSYKKYYRAEKSSNKKWSKREKPSFCDYGHEQA